MRFGTNNSWPQRNRSVAKLPDSVLDIPQLGISKPMFCQTYVLESVGFHKHDGNHEIDEDNSDSQKKGVECWTSGNHVIHGHDEKHGNPGCKQWLPPQ